MKFILLNTEVIRSNNWRVPTIDYVLQLLFSATYPLDLAKTRLQIQGEQLNNGSKVSSYAIDVRILIFCTPWKHHLCNSMVFQQTKTYRGLVRTATGIVYEEGFLGLWKGITPAILRYIPLIKIFLFSKFAIFFFKNYCINWTAWYLIHFQSVSVSSHYLYIDIDNSLIKK